MDINKRDSSPQSLNENRATHVGYQESPLPYSSNEKGILRNSLTQSYGAAANPNSNRPVMVPPPTSVLANVPGQETTVIACLTSTSRFSLVDAYLLALVFGYTGAHHFYLQRYRWGLVYLFTLGLFGCGYLLDLFRLPYLVRRCNKEEYQSRVGDGVRPHRKMKEISDAYIAWFPGGLFGFHHFYLNNYGWGLLYSVTLGLFGIGWIIDAFRMPYLVKKANEEAEFTHSSGTHAEKELWICYVLCILFGLLGAHHFYLNRRFYGLVYFMTVGLLGVGWVVDWFRMPILLRRCNNEIKETRPKEVKTLDDCYLLWFPFGLIGYHHFYLGRVSWGVLYHLTLGILGLGWLVDFFRIPSLVKESNRKREEWLQNCQLLNAGQGVQPLPAQHPLFFNPNPNGVPQDQASLLHHSYPPAMSPPVNGQCTRSFPTIDQQTVCPSLVPPAYEEYASQFPQTPSAPTMEPPPYEK